MLVRAGAVLLACLLPWFLEVCFQKTFRVPSSGSVLITGTSSGIGKHACLGLAQAHPELTFYCGVRKERDGERLVSEAKGATNVKYLILDTTNEDHIAAVAEKLKGETLVGLVNNAGVAIRPEALEFVDLADYRWLFDINFFGVLRLTQVLLPELRKNEGRVVVTSSIAGLMPGTPGGASYFASKHAVNAAFDSVRQEMAPHGVSVSLVCPAYVKAEIMNTMAARAAEQQPYSEEHRRLYPAQFKIMEMADKSMAMASEPDVTTEAIDHALTSPRPKTHYVVANVDGAPAWFVQRLFWLLPYRAADLLTPR